MAGTISAGITNPLDVVTVRLMTQGTHKEFTGILDCLVKTVSGQFSIIFSIGFHGLLLKCLTAEVQVILSRRWLAKATGPYGKGLDQGSRPSHQITVFTLLLMKPSSRYWVQIVENTTSK